jgi:DNA-binding CsgD family transcriptional regulator
MKLKQEQLENELKLKSGELASTLMIVRDKNEIFSDINDSLNAICGKLSSDEAKKEVRQLQLKINQSKERDNYWKKFEENFDLVHDAFFDKLRRDFPTLTPSDRKLCAFLKMNLSSKEMAQLTNISVRSVELGRYRLRKRLGLSRDDNLKEFLDEY